MNKHRRWLGGDRNGKPVIYTIPTPGTICYESVGIVDQLGNETYLEYSESLQSPVAQIHPHTVNGGYTEFSVIFPAARLYNSGTINVYDNPVTTIDGWISVNDRLPGVGEEVIIYRPNAKRFRVTAAARFIRYNGSLEYHWDNAYPGNGNMILSSSVSHWMPFPQPPSSEKI